MGKYYINQYIKNTAKQNNEDPFKRIIADIFIDVGEIQDDTVYELDEEMANNILTKTFLIKSGDVYFARTSDFLIGTGAATLAEYITQIYGNVIVNCCFGSVSWEANEPNLMAGFDLIVLVDYGEGFTKRGLIHMVM